MTILQRIKKGDIDPVIRDIAVIEKKEEYSLIESLGSGEVVIPKNISRKMKKPCGIGKGLKTKVNANIGTSPHHVKIEEEIEKLHIAEKCGADAVMDLSTGGDITAIRRKILAESNVPIGTVPIYQVTQRYINKKEPITKISENELFDAIEEHASDGVDFITVHCGVTQKVLDVMKQQKRLMDIVSRGGAILACWMLENNKENPLYSQFDRLLDIAEKYDLTLSLGDGMRPGCIADATDKPQIEELLVLGRLAEKAHARGVQAIIEGPGHIPLNEIKENIRMQKELCNNAPFYVLGPIVTDVAPGYDHITSAIGGAVAAMYGADFLCYVTPTEHLGLPGIQAVKEGVIAARIAAHAGDIAKGIKGAQDWDDEISAFRKNREWIKQIKISMDPEKAESIRKMDSSINDDICSMCGEYCSLKIMEEALGKKLE